MTCPITLALITQGNIRRGSIDLLEGLDLDFLHVRRNSALGSFDGDLFFDDTNYDDMQAEYFPQSVSSISDMGPRYSSGGGMDPMTGGHKNDLGAGDYLDRRGAPYQQQSMYNPYTGAHMGMGDIDMSAYDAVAESLHNYQTHGVSNSNGYS